jgi:hypothetical protein
MLAASPVRAAGGWGPAGYLVIDHRAACAVDAWGAAD